MSNDLLQPAGFVVILSGQPNKLRVPIQSARFIIGRVSENDLCLVEDRIVSRHHCAIHAAGAELSLEDLDSRNGTYLNGRRIRGTVPLALPAYLTIGHTRLALVPPLASDEQMTDIAELSFSGEGSILIPPSAFFQERAEAFLVVDLVDSTRLVRQGDIHLAQVVSVLGQILERDLRAEPEPFLKGTGDGFFACFGSARAALQAALKLPPGLVRHIPSPPQVSIGLHWGAARLTAEGDRTGGDVHAVFSVEHLRHLDQKLTQEFRAKSIQTLLLMSEAFWFQLTVPDRIKAQPIGLYPLKGLEGETRIFRWRAAFE